MNVKKQQMQLHLQQQPLQGRQNRTGFEVLLDQRAQVFETSMGVSRSTGGRSWSPTQSGSYQHPDHYDRRGTTGTSALESDPQNSPLTPLTSSPLSPTVVVATTLESVFDAGGIKTISDSPPATPPGRLTETVATPPPTSPLSLPSPYYDRNPIVAFPLNNHLHHGPRSPVTTVATTPLANVQNVVYPDDQDHANSSTYYYQRHHHYNYKSSSLINGRDDNKENVKQQDAECLHQQLDEVLKACVDYEERNKNRQQHPTTPTESSGNTSPCSMTTPPHQNRIKTNGSLPRDSKKPETSSPTNLSPSSPTNLSPTSPLSSTSMTALSFTSSPLSPSAMTWSTTATPSLSTLSPLSPPVSGVDNDSVFFENENVLSPTSAIVMAPLPSKVTTCGSPRTRIRTLVPYCPTTTATDTTNHITATTVATDLYYSSGKDQQLHHRRPHNSDSHEDCVPKISQSNFLSSRSPERLQQLSPTSLQSPLPPTWQRTTSWLNSSSFATDPIDNGMVTNSPMTERMAEAAEVRRKLLIELSAHKSRLVELHLRREEVDRELIIETALLRAELDVADDETRQSDNIVDGLDRATAECRQKMDMCTVKQQEQRTAADSQLAVHRQELQGLRNRLESIEDDDGLKIEIRASIDRQTEMLETEQKLYEDVEFGLLEEEAGWLARREELHRDRAAAVAVRRARRARAEWLRAQLDQLRSVGDDQLRALRADINGVTLSIQQGHKKLQDLDSMVDSTSVQDQYRRQQYHYDYSTEHQPPKSLEWASSSSWDQQSKSPVSPWYPFSNNTSSFPSTSIIESTGNNVNNLMTSSMTTTYCSSVGSSGAEDDGCRPVSDDSTSRMSMSTIFDGRSVVKLRPKNVSSPTDITKRPLTRYLPVRYDGDAAGENQIAFDLRAHIESAGHQLDDDSAVDNRGVNRHFWIDSSSCRGYLKKLSGTGGKNLHRSGRKWLKRWFVFDRRSRTLSYYHRRSDDNVTSADQCGSTEKKTRPRASIRFKDIQEVYVDHTNSSKGQGCAFVVKTAQRTFYLSAATGQAVRVWVDVIFTGAEGYREYLKSSTGNGIEAVHSAGNGQTKSS